MDTYVTRAYLTIKPTGIDLKYALALFNSKLFYYWLFHMGKRKGKQLQIDQAQLMELPIYLAKEEKQNEIILLLDELLLQLNDSKDISDLENKVDFWVYKIYSLTEEEIQKVESFVNEQRNL